MTGPFKTLLWVLCVCCAPLQAGEDKVDTDKGWYIGTGFSLGWGKETVDYQDETSHNEVSSLASAVTLGYITRHDHRFEVTYIKESLEFERSDQDGRLTSVDVESIFTFSDRLLEPYFRSGLGFVSSQYLNPGVPLKGVSLQVGTGLIYRPLASLELDVGIKVRGVGWRATRYQGEDLVVSTGLTQTSAAIRYIF